MRRSGILLVALALAGHAAATAAESYVREELRITAPNAGDGLEAVLLRLDEPGRHPLALVNHGSPRAASDRPGMTPLRMVPQGLEFARRGWAVALVLRRGYGGSGGGWAEDAGGCRSPDYETAGRKGAEDLRASIAYLAARPDIDASRIISVGVSAGGFATVALTADPPPGLAAAISFAGGRGSSAPDDVCRPDLEAMAFAAFGKRSRVPMLWVYAENDHFFGPEVAATFRDAFAAEGGVVEFVKPAAFGEDGHSLFSAAGIPIWTKLVDTFLAKQHLVLRDTIASLPQPKPPGFLSESARTAFAAYVAAAPHKAFAAAPAGGFGWRSGRRSPEEARAEALALCLKPDAKRACKVVAVDDDAAE